MSEPGKLDFTNLTENLSQQQAKISALKELVRQSESQHGKNTASAQEKVKNIAQRLSNLKSKTLKAKNRSTSDVSEEYGFTNIQEEDIQNESFSSTSLGHLSQRPRSETPGSEKITLLRKQMEVNRIKMAERESKSKEIEQMVTQLKSKLETSQMSLEKSVELGRSMGDLPSMFPFHSQSNLSSVSQTSQSYTFENERVKFLEKRIRELQETMKEKENLTESDKVQGLERKILDLEENLREKESIIDARTRAVSLLSENLTKKKKDVVDSLEETKQEMFKMQETFLETEESFKDEVDRLNSVINERDDNIDNFKERCEILEKSRYKLTIENSELKTKLEDVQDYSSKISELKKLNETLQKQISHLESQRYEFVSDEDLVETRENKETRNDLLEKIKTLEQALKSQRNENDQLHESLQEKIVEINVINANFGVLQEKYNALGPKSLFSDSGCDEDSQAEVSKLKQQLDESNKNMIKTKLKVKNLQKQVDLFNKIDRNQEVVGLNDEIQTLTQRIAELEANREKNDQQEKDEESGSEMEKKIQVLETTCQNQTSAIQLLEELKMDMTDELQSAKRDLENSKGKTEKLKIMEAVNSSLEQKVQQLSEEKDKIEAKLTCQINENLELNEKIEKGSKGSSAGSIEMVNEFTAQENEEYQKALRTHKDLVDEVGPQISQELNESLKSLREESSELMSKIELFTIERREVLDKLDTLTIENQMLVSSFETMKEEKIVLELQNRTLNENVKESETLINELQSQKEGFEINTSELIQQCSKLQEEINLLEKQKLDASPSCSLSNSEETEKQNSTVPSIDKEACLLLLKQLDHEIQSLNKNKDKQQKLKISKKLSENAKNVHTMMSNLLVDYFKTLDDCKKLRQDLDKVKILLNTLSNESEVELLKNTLKNTETLLISKNEELEELQTNLTSLQESTRVSSADKIEEMTSKLEEAMKEVSRKDESIEKLQEIIDELSNERDRSEVEIQKQRSLVNDLRKELDQLFDDVKVNNQRLNEKSTELDQLQREFDMRLRTSTNEVEVLKTLVSEQKKLLIDSYQEFELDINLKMKEVNDYQNQIKQMENEISTLSRQNTSNQESFAENINFEVSKLRELLEENKKLVDDQKEELLHKQETIDTLNNQIIDLYKTMEENSNKIIEKEDELQYLQEINTNNCEEIRKSNYQILELNKSLTDLNSQVSQKNSEIQLLQQRSSVQSEKLASDNRLKELENQVKSLEVKNRDQLEKLKKYAANLKKKQVQCSELEEKLAASSDVTNLSGVNELKAKVIQYEEQLKTVKIESKRLQKSSPSSEEDSSYFKKELEQKTEVLMQQATEISELKKHLEDTMSQNEKMEESSLNYQAQLLKLEAEKTKLIACSDSLNEITAELASIKIERNELISKLSEHESKEKVDDKKKMDKLKTVIVQLKHKLAEKKKDSDDLTEELNKLKNIGGGGSRDQSDIMKTQLQELQDMSSKILNDTKIAYEHDIGILRHQISELEAANRYLNEDKQRKLSLEGQLETFEMINVQLRNKVESLQEAIVVLESDKSSFQREKLSLAAELDEKDALIGEKLRETESDNFQLSESLKELNFERTSLQQKLLSAENQLSLNNERNCQQLLALECDNSRLQQQILNLQSDMKKNNISNEEILAAKHAEIDEMESELGLQLQKIEAEKKSIQEALEKTNDQIIDFQDEVIRLKDNEHTLEQAKSDLERELSWLKLQNENYTQDQLEIEQLRMQLMQSETETENLRSQNESLHEDHNVEIIILRQQINDLETMRSQVSQNQTDDQVMLQNENVKLKELLMDRESEIQQKTIQLQMVTFDAPIGVSDPFANLSAAPQSTSISDVTLLDKTQEEIEKLKEICVLKNLDFDLQSAKIEKLLQENQTLKGKSIEMQSMMDNFIRTNVEMEASLIEKNIMIKSLQTIVNKSELPPITSAPTGTSALFGDNSPQTSSSTAFFEPLASDDFPQEVVEEIIEPKNAYLCYDRQTASGTQTDDDWLRVMNENKNYIEQLQAQQLQIELLERTIFEQSGRQPDIPQQSNFFDSLPSMVPTELGAHHVEQNQSMAALEIEDGWGWGSNSVSELQYEAHHGQESLLSPKSDLEVRLQEQKDNVERLEQEKMSSNEELLVLKENSKKMMKKLKEYQLKVKELESKALRKSSSVESNDMDLVIQEELNSQIQKLELRLKELNADKDKEHQEKELFMKRVDILTTANERMIESKERQDNQMEMYQMKIRELNQKLQNLEEWGNTDEDKKSQSSTQMSPLKESQSELLNQIQDLNDRIKDMQVDYDEMQALLEEEKSSNKTLESRLENLSLLQVQAPSRDKEIEHLNKILSETLPERENLKHQMQIKDQEIRELIEKIDQLSVESSNIKTILDDLSSQIQFKTNENQELNQRLQKLATNNEELSRERQIYSDSIERDFRQKAEDLEQQLSSLVAEVQYKNSQILQMNDKMSELSLESDQTQSLIETIKAKDEEMQSLRIKFQSLETQLETTSSADSNPDDFNKKKLQELENENSSLKQEKAMMEHELRVLNDQVLASIEFEDKMKNAVFELDAKDIEIHMLKVSLETLQKHSGDVQSDTQEILKLKHEKNELEHNMKSQIDLINAQWSQAVEQRGSEVANSWKQHLEMREQEFEANMKNGEGPKDSDYAKNENETIAKMRQIMEAQEVEIVSLKEQLAIRSAEFASLSARVDPYHQMNVSPVPSAEECERVPRSELDLALYMLHQREMRLEEMTMEIFRLIEERDELQLRLSDSIRQIEDVKRKINVAHDAELSDVSKTTTPEKSSSTASIAFVEDEHLKAKLSELTKVRHVRDKAIQDEREQRFMDNISLLQRDIANIPQEAAARIVAGSSDQSPSSVLMNWILGKSPESP